MRGARAARSLHLAPHFSPLASLRWQSSRTGRADHAWVRLSVEADQRRALQSSSASWKRSSTSLPTFRISVARFNRRLHQLADWMAWIPEVLGEVFTTGDVVIIDRLPALVCRRVRARRCRKVRGREFCGYCAAKREKFFGWRVHLVCRPDGVPVRVQMLPAGLHDLTPVHELAYGLPAGARRLGVRSPLSVTANNYSPLPSRNSATDEASILAETGAPLVVRTGANMRPHAWFMDVIELRAYRHTIETVNSQLERMGVERLYARTNARFELKAP